MRCSQTSTKDGLQEAPDFYKKSVCPNSAKCGEENLNLYKFTDFKEISKEFSAEDYISKDSEQCSYWIRPPNEMEELDFMNLQFINFN